MANLLAEEIVSPDSQAFRVSDASNRRDYLAVVRSCLKNGNRSVELDFVRGVAILLVIGFHALAPQSPYPFVSAVEGTLKAVGWSGVDLFFVLSGFLVGGVLLSEYRKTEALDVKRFIVRRGLKIWPAYYCYILFQIIARKHPIRSFLFANLLHLQNYIGSSLEHTWTLAVEEHFYLLLSVSIGWMVLRRWSTDRMIAVFAVLLPLVLAVRCTTWYAGFHQMAQWATHTRIDSLLFGMILTALLQFYPNQFEWIARRKGLLISIWVSAMAFMIFANQKPAILYTIGYTYIYLGYGAFMLLLYRHSGAIRDFALYRLVAKIGVYSYGIYLWHLSVREACLGIANHLNLPLRWPAAIVLQYATAIVLGAILTHLIEWPVLRIRDRFFPAKDRLQSLIVTPDVSSASATASILPRRVPLTVEPSA